MAQPLVARGDRLEQVALPPRPGSERHLATQIAQAHDLAGGEGTDAERQPRVWFTWTLEKIAGAVNGRRGRSGR